jgi:UDP-N-acetylmuramate dehydrogenase
VTAPTVRDPSVLERVAAALGDRAVRQAPLGMLTTYRVGGRAALSVVVDSEADAAGLHRALVGAGTAVPVLVMGKGSNLLVAEAGFPGVVVTLGPALSTIAVTGDGARAGGGAGFPVLARRTAAAGLRGLEWAVGVPGSVGGAVRMNAGGHGSDTATALLRARVFDLAAGEGRHAATTALALGYRRSALGPGEIVTEADFHLDPGDRGEAERAVAQVVRWRREHQPGGSNAGSVFTNPPGDAAGRLVESVGLRGFRLGSAEVSSKHANFIQADPDGSADDVRRLIDHVQAAVAERAGVDLVPEVRMVGFADPTGLEVTAR